MPTVCSLGEGLLQEDIVQTTVYFIGTRLGRKDDYTQQKMISTVPESHIVLQESATTIQYTL